ncbi:hypothetical protein GCM10009821_11090 [Aeromicrobium halocynthiae]|uniref:S1 motif domain-containing protein n=1 Tax=Aeromicrobium halocynthiae TaxID=560557 RepID=A0ABN2VVS4_9ACTN
MLDDDTPQTPATSTTATTRSTSRRTAGRPAGPPSVVESGAAADEAQTVPMPEGPKAASSGVTTSTESAAKRRAARRRTASATPAEAPQPSEAEPQAEVEQVADPSDASAPETAVPAEPTTGPAKAGRKRSGTRKKAAPTRDEQLPLDEAVDAPTSDSRASQEPAEEVPADEAPRKVSTRAGKKKAPVAESPVEDDATGDDAPAAGAAATIAPAFAVPTFQAPEPVAAPQRPATAVEPEDDEDEDDDDNDTSGSGGGQSKRRRRSRGGRRRNKSDDSAQGSDDDSAADTSQDESTDDGEDDSTEGGGGGTRRRRRRARSGERAQSSPDDPDNTVVKVREGRSAEDEITGVTGSTRLEAKKQRRREGREAGRRRAPIVSEAEFLARRESVERTMVVRQRPADADGSDDYTQIAVLEDSVLVEHYVARESQVSIIGNVYLGKVQNVLPSMEAAFVDIGAGRNAVIYAGEVDWSGVENGKARKIEEALSPGQTILVQVSKDPVGQKGARLTSQISLPGRFLVYVPGGQSNGISRKLPDTERARLKGLLKEVLPEDAGVIVRTAAEGATEEQLTRDVAALKARWEDIERKVEQATSGQAKAPQLLYAEPDLVIKVVRDLFNEDFDSLVVEGPDAWDNISGYIRHVAPDLAERLQEWQPQEHDGKGSFESFRIDEQIHKALERKVWLPSGGSLVIDRTEAMTVVDVNTGKFTGSGGNLEETVTKNNLEAAEEIVRQLRLRDIGGIIVVDFIDMVLESNRELVLRRLVECLGRDRTRHQVAEVTSLGLVQMTRKRIGTGLLESFSTDCDHCKGRGVVITAEPVEPVKDDGQRRGGGRRRGGRGGNGNGNGGNGGNGGNNGGGRSGGQGGNRSANGSNGAASPSDESTPKDASGSADQSTSSKPAETAESAEAAVEPVDVTGPKEPVDGPVLTDTPDAP